jgi:hypothetical protein
MTELKDGGLLAVFVKSEKIERVLDSIIDNFNG